MLRAAGRRTPAAGGVSQRLALDPVGIPGRQGLADALADMGRTKEALDVYRDLTTQSSAAYLAIARLLLLRELAKPVDDRKWDDIDKALNAADSNGMQSVQLTILCRS